MHRAVPIPQKTPAGLGNQEQKYPPELGGIVTDSGRFVGLIKGRPLIKSWENSGVPISSGALGCRDLLGHAVGKEGVKHWMGEITAGVVLLYGITWNFLYFYVGFREGQ